MVTGPGPAEDKGGEKDGQGPQGRMADQVKQGKGKGGAQVGPAQAGKEALVLKSFFQKVLQSESEGRFFDQCGKGQISYTYLNIRAGEGPGKKTQGCGEQEAGSA